MNRIENTLSIPDRSIQTGLTIPSNIFDTLAAFPKDMKGVVKYTSDEIKNIFKSAVTKGKRYQKIGNTILSPFVALGAAVEGTVRTVVTPTVNLFANTLKTGVNTVDNAWKSTFGSVLSDKPVSNFEYVELKTANAIKKNKNWFSKWRFDRKVFQNN